MQQKNRQIATFPFRVLSPMQCLTSEFGMGSGGSTAINRRYRDSLFPDNRLSCIFLLFLTYFLFSLL